MLYRIILVSDIVGLACDTALSIAPILGESERNNRRDEITGALLFHGGQAVLAVEGARTDLDRLMTRLGRDRRHDRLTVVSDRPVVQRRFHQAMRLSNPSTQHMATATGGRPLSSLGVTEIEALLTTDDAVQTSAA